MGYYFSQLVACDQVRTRGFEQTLGEYCGPDPRAAPHVTSGVQEEYASCRRTMESYNGTMSCSFLSGYEVTRQVSQSPVGVFVFGRIFWEGLVWTKKAIDAPSDTKSPLKSLAKKVFVLGCGATMVGVALEFGGVPAMICGFAYPVLLGMNFFLSEGHHAVPAAVHVE